MRQSTSITYQQDSSVLKPDIVNKKKPKIIYKTKLNDHILNKLLNINY